MEKSNNVVVGSCIGCFRASWHSGCTAVPRLALNLPVSSGALRMGWWCIRWKSIRKLWVRVSPRKDCGYVCYTPLYFSCLTACDGNHSAACPSRTLLSLFFSFFLAIDRRVLLFYTCLLAGTLVVFFWFTYRVTVRYSKLYYFFYI